MEMHALGTASQGEDLTRPLLRGRVHAGVRSERYCVCQYYHYSNIGALDDGANPVECSAISHTDDNTEVSSCEAYIIYSPGEMHALSQQQPPALAHGW